MAGLNAGRLGPGWEEQAGNPFLSPGGSANSVSQPGGARGAVRALCKG